MKQILGIGILLLCVMLALNAGAALPPSVADGQPEDGSASVLIYSMAQWHKAARYGARRTPIAIIVNGQFRSGPLDEPGLRVIAINRGKAGALHSFDVANSEAEIGRLVEFCDSATPGTVLSLGVYRVASPEPEHSQLAWQRLDELYRELGAHKPPTESPKASWAYMSVRDEEMWRPLAEVQSLTRGVALAHTLGADPLRPAANYFPLVDEWREISLIDRFEAASYVTEGFTEVYRPTNSVSGGTLDAILAHPPYGAQASELSHADNRLVWDDFEVPAEARFRCQLGIRSWARPRSDGVVYRLVFDDVVIGEIEKGVAPFDPDTWTPWVVDLSKYSGRRVRVELRVDSRGNTTSDHALWGDPVIEYLAETASMAGAPEK